MQKRVVLVDPNPAIQAIVSLALSQLNLNLTVISSRPEHYLQREKVDLILHAIDPDDTEGLRLCRALKKSHPSTKFVLLVKREDEKQLEKKISQADVDEVLYKPLRSEQIQQSVSRLLALTCTSDGEDEILIALNDRLTKEYLKVVLGRLKVGHGVCDTVDEITRALRQRNYSIVISDFVDDQLLKLDLKSASRLILIREQGADQKTSISTAQVLSRLLSYSMLISTLGIESPQKQGETEFVLDETTKAILAARISAGIFETLLNRHAFVKGDWETMRESVGDEFMRICRDFDLLKLSLVDGKLSPNAQEPN